MQTAVAIARPGSIIGYVGVPHGVEMPVPTLFYRNIGAHGGPAPARAYLSELMEDVLDRRINPGRVFDFTTDLEGIADAYAAMDERRAIKSLVKVGTI
jgi:threonine dehydrogenase-like Zn-dependent dehydrogenase